MIEKIPEKELYELFEQYQHILGGQKNVFGLKVIDIVQRIVNYYEDIINHLPGNVYWFNKDCIGVGANKNVLDQLSLSSTQEFKGLDYQKISKRAGWGQEETNFFEQQSFEVLRTGHAKINIEEPPIPDHNGNPTFFLSSRVPLFDHYKNIIGMAGISIDITELKRIQQDLRIAKEVAEQASQLKSEFVANMSHDVKTPLAGIIGLSELLTDRLEGEEQILANKLLMSGKQLLNFLENCLQVFKLETSETLLEKETFNLNDLMSEIRNLFEPSTLIKKLTLTIEIDDSCPSRLIGSRDKIFRILSNLVSNAVKFTEEGFILVTARVLPSPLNLSLDQALIEFTIRDTGIGIPKDWLHSIFEQFTRLTPSYKGIYDGHGIGLYIVNKFIKAMNGTIRVESEEHKGSTFILNIPFSYNYSDQELKTTFQPDETQIFSKKTSTTSLNILIVEDHHIAQVMLSRLLSSIGHNVTLASSGEEAVSLFESGLFDLIFMDLGLPGIQGDVASQKIREKEKKDEPRVLIIGLTAHISQEISENLDDMKIDMILNKPLSREKAQQIINSYKIIKPTHRNEQ